MKHIKLFEQFDDYELDDIFGKNKTIYSEKFTQFLEEKGIYDEYLYEIRMKMKKPNACVEEINDFINGRLMGPTQIINSSLDWANTEKGYGYWQQIHWDFDRFCRENHIK